MRYNPLPQENIFKLAKGLKGSIWVSFNKAYDWWFYKEDISREYFFFYIQRRKSSHADYFRKDEDGKWEFDLGRWIDDEKIRNAQIAEIERLYFIAKEKGLSDYALAKMVAKRGMHSKKGVLMMLRRFIFSDKSRGAFLKVLKELESADFKDK